MEIINSNSQFKSGWRTLKRDDDLSETSAKSCNGVCENTVEDYKKVGNEVITQSSQSQNTEMVELLKELCRMLDILNATISDKLDNINNALNQIQLLLEKNSDKSQKKQGLGLIQKLKFKD